MSASAITVENIIPTPEAKNIEDIKKKIGLVDVIKVITKSVVAEIIKRNDANFTLFLLVCFKNLPFMKAPKDKLIAIKKEINPN